MSRLEIQKAHDIHTLVTHLVKGLAFAHVKLDQVHCVRSNGSTSRAYARIWGLPRIFQVGAGYTPTYVIEVISSYFDRLPHEEKLKVLIHELLHIPRTFSGSLKSHKGRFHRIGKREVEKWYALIESTPIKSGSKVHKVESL
ncbi:MAG TPA: putative metallopeptidase [Patescibacteria group bacterium]|nr:putative metallopeptidase [Patescibacteria group bacterium]